MNFVIYEPFLHFVPTGEGWIEGLVKNGHQATALSSFIYKLHTLVISNADCIIIMELPHKQSLEAFKQNNPDIKVVLVGFQYDPEAILLKDYVDFWFELHYKHDAMEEFFNYNGLELHMIPLAASEDIFKPLQQKKIYDLSFIGQFGNKGHGYREEDTYLYPLKSLGLKGYYSGFDSFPQTAHEDLNVVYNSTKVNINFHYYYQKNQFQNLESKLDFNGRVFELALSGNFQLCDLPHVSDLFENGVTFTSKEDWKDTFNYYLHNTEAREEQARIARNIALEKHTWKSRMKQFLEIISLDK
jgi:spore maturation protein CgeB